MHDVGAAWLMTTLSPSPVLVSLLQTATTLPVFILALPAGALADLVDRRRLLMFTQGWMCVAAGTLGVLALAGLSTPWMLLAFTFALGLGAALNMPAWQATTPELVSREELPAAAALSGVAVNIARAVGPAMGGLIVAEIGAWAVFVLNAVSFIAVMIVLYRWHRSPRESVLPAERFLGAMRTGLRYLRHAPGLHAVIVRTLGFIVCGSAVWALLPLIARQELGLTSLGYGLLLGCLGLGAVAGAAALPWVRRKIGTDALAAGATVIWAGATLALAYVRVVGWLYAVMAIGGAAWIGFMASLNAAAQTAVPSWVRARALAVYLLAFMGGMAGGSALWGTVAAYEGIPFALTCAALGLVLGLPAAARYRLAADTDLDLTPSLHWPAPAVALEPDLEGGPVLVTVEYRIDPERSHEFSRTMHAQSRVRRRDGAIQWGLFVDVTDPGRYVETFVVESWAEHLRQHERVTVADRDLEDRTRSFHIGDTPPVVSHFIYSY